MKPAKIHPIRPYVRPQVSVYRPAAPSFTRTTQFTNGFHTTPLRQAPQGGFTSMLRDRFQQLSSKLGLGRDENKTSTTEEGTHEKGKQGFASMPKEKVQDIASKGGQASHRGTSKDSTMNERNTSGETHEKGKQGFASMPREQVQEITSKGGHASHKNTTNRNESSSASSNSGQHEKGKQGFASMPHERVQEIASQGGQASHKKEKPLPGLESTQQTTAP